AERYTEYGAAVAPLLAKVGGQPIFAGRPAETLIGEGEWDLMVLVSYPTRQAFLDMVSSPDYRAIAHLRTEALRRSELRAMDSLAPDELGHLYPSRGRRASNRITAAATDAFSESIRPASGMETSSSQAPATRGRSPEPSEPRTTTA